MIESIVFYAGVTAITAYLAGALIILMGFLNERNPLSHVVYLPLILLWPIIFGYQLWGLRHCQEHPAASDICVVAEVRARILKGGGE